MIPECGGIVSGGERHLLYCRLRQFLQLAQKVLKLNSAGIVFANAPM
jgi:hypothetical protein